MSKSLSLDRIVELRQQAVRHGQHNFHIRYGFTLSPGEMNDLLDAYMEKFFYRPKEAANV